MFSLGRCQGKGEKDVTRMDITRSLKGLKLETFDQLNPRSLKGIKHAASEQLAPIGLMVDKEYFKWQFSNLFFS